MFFKRQEFFTKCLVDQIYTFLCLYYTVFSYLVKKGRLAQWSKALVNRYHKNLHGFELTLSRFLEIIFLLIVQQKVVNVADKAINYCLQADNKSYYISQLQGTTSNKKYSWSDVLEVCYIYQMYPTVSCQKYSWSTAGKGTRLKAVEITTERFAVYGSL